MPRSRELFLLAVISLALGTGLVAQAIGLSLAFGAFLAGLVIAESEYRSQVVAEVLPFRDLFTSLFFVSVGMLIDPWAVVALLSGLVVPATLEVAVPDVLDDLVAGQEPALVEHEVFEDRVRLTPGPLPGPP